MSENDVTAQIAALEDKYVNRVMTRALIDEIAADISKSAAFNGVRVHATPEQLARGEITVEFPPVLGYFKIDPSVYPFPEVDGTD